MDVLLPTPSRSRQHEIDRARITIDLKKIDRVIRSGTGGEGAFFHQVAFLGLTLLFKTEVRSAVIDRAIAVLILSRLWRSMIANPTRLRIAMRSRVPSKSFMKRLWL